MFKFILLVCSLFVSYNSFAACVLQMPKTEILKAIAGQALNPANTCAALPSDPCLCVDGVDFRVVDYLLDKDKLEINKQKLSDVTGSDNQTRRAQLDALLATDISAYKVDQLAAYIRQLIPFIFENRIK